MSPDRVGRARSLPLSLKTAGILPFLTVLAVSAYTQVPRGVFSLDQEGGTATQTVLDNPDVMGITVRQSWAYLDPNECEFDFCYLDSEIERAAAAGKKVLLRIGTQAGKPPWVTQAIKDADCTFVTFQDQNERGGPLPSSAHMKTTTLPLRHSMNLSPVRLGLLLIPLVLTCFVLTPEARATCQEGCGDVFSENIFSGEDALINNTSGTGNTALGFNALFNNTTGRVNTANGLQALYLNTTGYFNTASGGGALFSNDWSPA
jgi:hypothetical protein